MLTWYTVHIRTQLRIYGQIYPFVWRSSRGRSPRELLYMDAILLIYGQTGAWTLFHSVDCWQNDVLFGCNSVVFKIKIKISHQNVASKCLIKIDYKNVSSKCLRNSLQYFSSKSFIKMSHSCLIMSYHVSPCLIMSHQVSSCVTMSHHVSSCLIMSHHVSSCPAISSLLQPIPAYSSLLQTIPAYSSIFRPIPAYSSRF